MTGDGGEAPPHDDRRRTAPAALAAPDGASAARDARPPGLRPAKPRRSGRAAFAAGAVLTALILALAGAHLAGLLPAPAGGFLRVDVVAAAVIFVATYAVVALGKLPGSRIDRAGAALLGASLMVAVGVLSPEEAYRAVDGSTIVLLLGMMIVAANLELAGFFRLVNGWLVPRARHPLVLLAAIAVAAATASAFLVNDTICLVMTPLVLDLLQRLRRDPVPYLLAVATASNVGSVATITGNPQNIIIGSLSHISYGAFAGALAPVAAIGLVIDVALICLLFPREFLTRERLVAAPPAARHSPVLVIKSAAVLAVMIGLFFLGAPIASVAILGGAFLLLTRRIKSEKVYNRIDWPLLVMFAGLFIVVAGIEKVAMTPAALAFVGTLHLGDRTVLSLVTAALSNLVSNVPAVLMLRPFVAALADPARAWLVVAMASTLAGNLTLVGSVANLIVAQRARAGGIEIGFLTYLRLGIPLTVMTILAGVLLM
jgi:Na+/H+ antiporter NhaD/arsenite permease-like protein